MKRIALCIIVVLCGLFAFRLSAGCSIMSDNLHISFLAIQTQTIGDIHNDSNTPIVLVRFFHNRITATLLAVIKTYLAYFNFLFLFRLISFGGFTGIFFGLWYGFLDKRKLIKVLFAVTFSFPLLFMFLPTNGTQFLQLIVFAILLIICSLYGWLSLMKESTKAFVPIACTVFVITLWWFFVFQFSIIHFCTLQ